MFDLIPIGGLCNRMRAMDAAMALRARRGDQLRVHWMVDDGLNASFHSLFLPMKDVEVVESLPCLSRFALRFGRFHGLMYAIGKLKGVSYYHHDEYDRSVQDASTGRLMELPRIHMISFGRFFPTAKNYQEFKPIAALEERINSIARQFDQWTVGVHIRRTDNLNAIDGSPTWRFVEAMDDAVLKEPRTRFYLATDCMNTKGEITDRFGLRIITDPKPVSRSSEEGMQHALVELYVLSKTSYMLRSHFSSYSRTAAEIGGISSKVIGQPATVE